MSREKKSGRFCLLAAPSLLTNRAILLLFFFYSHKSRAINLINSSTFSSTEMQRRGIEMPLKRSRFINETFNANWLHSIFSKMDSELICVFFPLTFRDPHRAEQNFSITRRRCRNYWNFFITIARFKLACSFNISLCILLANCSLRVRLLNSPKVKRKKAGRGIYVFSLEARPIPNPHYTLHRAERYECAPMQVVNGEVIQQTFNDVLGRIALCFLVDQYSTTLCHNWSTKETGRKCRKLKKSMKQNEIFCRKEHIFKRKIKFSSLWYFYLAEKDEENNLYQSLLEKVYAEISFNLSARLMFFL